MSGWNLSPYSSFVEFYRNMLLPLNNLLILIDKVCSSELLVVHFNCTVGFLNLCEFDICDIFGGSNIQTYSAQSQNGVNECDWKHCALPWDCHSRAFIHHRIQFHQPKYPPLTNLAEVMVQLWNSATATLTPGDGITDQLILQYGENLLGYRKNNNGPKTY